MDLRDIGTDTRGDNDRRLITVPLQPGSGALGRVVRVIFTNAGGDNQMPSHCSIKSGSRALGLDEGVILADYFHEQTFGQDYVCGCVQSTGCLI